MVGFLARLLAAAGSILGQQTSPEHHQLVAFERWNL
jgi:hypothetical protein